jgi:ABC-type transport auxiliary lipoprotein component
VPDYQVTVEVTRFDGGTGGEVVLAARWSLLGADGQELVMRKSRCTLAANRQDYEATVTAMSRTLEALSSPQTLTSAWRSEGFAAPSLPQSLFPGPAPQDTRRQRPSKSGGSCRWFNQTGPSVPMITRS